jgi:TonB-dependent receptor
MLQTRNGSPLYRLLVALALFSCLYATDSSAQGRSGAIAGTVEDTTHAVLKGAQVSVDEAGVSTVSDDQGHFLIANLTPASYTLTITYVGFALLTQKVDVTSGQTATVTETLQVAGLQETELVTAPRLTGEAETLNIQRTSDNIVQVLASEVIRSLPNANMADALGRLPSVTLERDEGEGKYVQVRGTEPRLTNTTVDGINLPSQEPGVRQIKFDAIPADIVERVDVHKTLLANMDGDGIGGSVDLVTKMAANRPTIALGTLVGYTPIINGRGLTENTGTIGSRFGSDHQFGILVGGSYDWNGRGIDDIEPVPDVATLPSGSTSTWYDAMDIRQYQYFRSRWGVAGSADDRLSAGSDIAVRWMYSNFKNYGDRYVYSLTDNTTGIQLLNPGNVGCGTDDAGNTVGPCTGTPSFNTQVRKPDIGVGSLSVGGKHTLGSTWFSWDASGGHSTYGNSPSSTAGFSSTLDTSACQFNPTGTTNQFLPRWNSTCFSEAFAPANMLLGSISRSLGPSAQTNWTGAGSAGKLYHLGSRASTLEAGAKYRHEDKYNHSYTVRYTANTDIPMTAFPNALTNDRYYLGGQYPLGHNPNYDDVFNFAQANPALFDFSSTQGHSASTFSLTEQVTAGYVMNTIDLSSQARFIAGVRVEHTSDDVSNYSLGKFPCPAPQSGTCTSITPNTFSGSYTTVLPSASLAYRLGDNNTLRFVYARGLSRPDPQDIAQAESWSISANGSNRYALSLGNANLKAETGDDFDVLLDHYMKPLGNVSAGFFYKALRNPIVTHSFLLTDYQPAGGPLGTYLATQPVNAGSAWVSGLELSYLQHFPTLPGMFGGLGLSANYGYTASRTSEIPNRSDSPRLQRTSPNAFNISPTYDRGPVSLRVGMSYNQASIYSYQYADGTPGGVKGPLSDIYFYNHFQIDAQASIRVHRELNVIVSGLNLNNEVFGFYQGSPQFMIQREYYQPTFAVGLRWTPGF